MNIADFAIPGYSMLESLSQGTRTQVYRAVKLESQQPVIIKVLAHQHPTLGELIQFRNQYVITRHLNHPAIVSPLALERDGNGYALVLPDDGFVGLPTYWQQRDFNLSAILTIVIQLVDALHYLIEQRVIHKDIKPDNIIIHPETGQVQLIDFSISSLLPKEQSKLTNPNVLEGTLAYISPEQTGRMNRGIDYRTDFYALGVTLFELLVGQRPFLTHDPMELVHCHLACPVTFSESSQPMIPAMVQMITRKLMAKNAEDRYQSALGLKHDLNSCWQQWEGTGDIKPFELGQRDVCDRFLIPERLYGRSQEVQALLDAFERVSSKTGNHPKSELMLVAGFSGIGKTAIVNEVHKPITRQKGYFIQGKFDQFNCNVPFSAFVQAFRSLIEQLLGDSDNALSIWKTKILDAVESNGQVILDVIPELEHIIGKQPAVSDLSGSAAQNRFNLLFGKFLGVFTTADHPLVIFLDDLQWADSASLNLLKLLMGESASGYLLVLGAYRDNEVFPAHPLMLTLDEMRKQDTPLHTLTLAPLNQANITCLVADTLRCSTEIAAPLSELTYQKTQGNPFFTTQFLQGLYVDHWIVFDVDKGYWQCDLAQVRRLALTDDVVEFMGGRLRQLPTATQNVLKLATCIGNRFDLATLAVVCEDSQETVAEDLWRSLQAGLVTPENETYKFFQNGDPEIAKTTDITVSYRFLHDRVQQAAYGLIPDEQKATRHLSIGRLLLATMHVNPIEENIFAIVNQLNRGVTLIDDKTEKIELARLNLKAGNRAKAAVAYSAAVDYLETGIELLGPDRWHDNYDLSLELYNAAVEAAYLHSHYSLMEQWLAEIFRHVPLLLDRVTAYGVKIQAQIARNQLKEAVETGLSVLEKLDIHLSFAPTQDDIEQGFATTIAQLEGKAPEDLLALADMTSPDALAALKMLAGIWGPAFAIAPPLMPMVVLEMVKLSVRHGNAPISAFAYVLYGVLLCGGENFQAGYEFGELSLTLLNRFNTQAFRAKILFLIGTHITIWQEPVRVALPTLKNAYQAGLETGDLEFAALPAAIYAYYSYLAGSPLSDVKQEFVAYTQGVEKIKQTYYLSFLQIWHQAIANLLGQSPQANHLVGEICNGDELLTAFKRDNVTTPMAYIYINRLMLNYLFGHYAEAVDVSPLADEYAQMVPATLLIPIANFYGSLSKVAICDHGSESECDALLSSVDINQRKMKQWSECAPMNYLHKYHLVEAERHRVLGNKIESIELYDLAIAGANANQYIQEAAIANELAAKFYLDWGKENIAQTYMVESYYCYAHWGAKAKIDYLETEYPQLLRPIFQPSHPLISGLETLTSTSSSHAPGSSLSKTTQTLTSTNTALDLVTILKASQAISSTIDLAELLGQLTQIVLQNSGGDRCAIMLCEQDNEVKVRAIATTDTTDLTEMSLQEVTHLPIQLIQYVKHTLEAIVMDNPDSKLPVVDSDLVNREPASAICLPLVDRAQLRGVLYVENQSTSNVFYPGRLAALKLLATQAAIALENARLYQQAQDYAQRLEASQLQLVQSEKMSALGNLVAGVAHEINNPLGFIDGNIEELQTSLQEIIEYLALYEETFPSPGHAIEEKREELDIEYLLEDIPKMLTSMVTGCDRIRNISQSLRLLARTDTDTMFDTDIHGGIDSSLLILKYRLKANDHRPEINVMRNYGELPDIACFPGQLSQAFMNIFANAIDMFDEIAEGQSFEALEASPQQITICTQWLDAQQIEIRIIDNGTGMPKAICLKIFDRQFTTKAVGKGTGLGLAIAHQVITEKHGGNLEVSSELGQGTEFIIRLPIES